jgi:glycosyltransferase involved in cell wall biosynthesis
MYVLLPIWIIQRCLSIRYAAVLLSTGLVGNSLLIWVLALLRVPTVGFAYAEELTIPLKSKGLKNSIKRQLLRRSYRHASGFVAVCNFTKQVLGSVGVSPERVQVIPPTISVVKNSKPSRETTGGRRILSVGRLVARKGFNYLIEAVQILAKDIPDADLTIVGNGSEWDHLQNLIRERNLENHIHLAGQVPDDELAKLYQECSVFVLANVMLENGDCEGAPTVLIEASSYGKPVIAGSSGGTDAMVDDGETGYLVDPKDVPGLADRLKEILLNPVLAERLGAAGQRKVTREHLPQEAGQHLRAFVARLVMPLPRRSESLSCGH